MTGLLVAVMATSSSPSTPSNPSNGPGVDARLIFHSVWTGVWSAVTSSPWIGAVLTLVLLGNVVRFVRATIHSGPCDPVRRFASADRREILRRAGGRCEYHSLLFGRCRATRDLEGDHIHPHSRGGWTNVANGQALCRRHNRLKLARVPFDFQLRALERRRASYFPPGVSGAVIRRSR